MLDLTTMEGWQVVAEKAAQSAAEWQEVDDPNASGIALQWHRIAAAIKTIGQLQSQIDYTPTAHPHEHPKSM